MTRKIESPLVHLLLLSGAVVMLMPFAWMLSTSLKPQNEVFSYPPQWIPSTLLWENYARAWAAAPFGRYFFNSALVALTVTLADVVTSSLAAFAFGRMEFPLRNALFTVFLASLMIPHQMTIIPAFLLLKTFGEISPAIGLDTYFSLIAPFAASAFGVFMLRQSFMQLPNELEDAATLDGCGRLGFLTRVVLPLSRPALATLALFAFQGNWNSYLWPLIVTNSDGMRTVQIGLRYFVGQEGSSQWGLLMAAAVFVSMPVVILYLFVQRQFVQGIAATGIKQ